MEQLTLSNANGSTLANNSVMFVNFKAQGQDIIERAQRHVDGGSTTFTVDSRNGATWDEFLGSSFGGSRFRMLGERTPDIRAQMGGIVEPQRAFVYASWPNRGEVGSKEYLVVWQVGVN